MRAQLYQLTLIALSAAACAEVGGNRADRTCKPPVADAESSGLAIRNGQVASSDVYPYVGMLFYDGIEVLPGPLGLPQVGRDTRICSAVLLCSNVVMTAAHCFADAKNPGNYAFYRGLSPGESPSSASTGILPPILTSAARSAQLLQELGPDKAAGKPARGKRVEILNAKGAKGSLDLAILQLDRQLAGKLASLGVDRLVDNGKDSLRATLVGYGATGTKDGKERGSGTKKIGSMRFAGYMDTPDNASLDGLGRLYPLDGIGADAASSDNACPGDSGGATIVNGKVYGLISRIMNFRDGKFQPTPNCASSNITLFTSVQDQLPWINQTMKAMCASGAGALDVASSAAAGGGGKSSSNLESSSGETDSSGQDDSGSDEGC